MISYLLILGISLVPISLLIRDVLRFNNDNYNPYLFKQTKDNNPYTYLIPLLETWVMFVAVHLFLNDLSLLTLTVYAFLSTSVLYLISTNVLNWKMYRKDKDIKIVYHTVVFDIIALLIVYFFLHIILKTF